MLFRSNMYAYCKGNPVMFSDPSGMGIKEWWAGFQETLAFKILITPFVLIGVAGFIAYKAIQLLAPAAMDILGGFCNPILEGLGEGLLPFLSAASGFAGKFVGWLAGVTAPFLAGTAPWLTTVLMGLSGVLNAGAWIFGVLATVSFGLIWLNTTLFIPVLKHLYKLCGGEDPAYWPGSGLWTDSEYAVFEAESILGGLFGAGGSSSGNGVAAAGEVGAADNREVYLDPGLFWRLAKVKQVNLLMQNQLVGAQATLIAKFSKGTGRNDKIHWTSSSNTLNPNGSAIVQFGQPNSARTSIKGNSLGYGMAMVQLTLPTIPPTYQYADVRVAVINRASYEFYVMMKDADNSTTLYQQPTTSTDTALKNTTHKRNRNDAPVKVVGTYGNFYFVDTGLPIETERRWMFVEMSKVEAIRQPKNVFLWPLEYRWRLGRGWLGEDVHEGLDINRTSRPDSNDSSSHANSSPYNKDISGAFVIAAAAGTIDHRVDEHPDNNKLEYLNEGRGNCIGILHDNGYRTVYQHLQKDSVINAVPNVTKVEKGQRIGRVGSSGNSDGPHLHFEVHQKKSSGDYEKIDPGQFYNSLTTF